MQNQKRTNLNAAGLSRSKRAGLPLRVPGASCAGRVLTGEDIPPPGRRHRPSPPACVTGLTGSSFRSACPTDHHVLRLHSSPPRAAATRSQSSNPEAPARERRVNFILSGLIAEFVLVRGELVRGEAGQDTAWTSVLQTQRRWHASVCYDDDREPTEALIAWKAWKGVM